MPDAEPLTAAACAACLSALFCCRIPLVTAAWAALGDVCWAAAAAAAAVWK